MLLKNAKGEFIPNIENMEYMNNEILELQKRVFRLLTVCELTCIVCPRHGTKECETCAVRKAIENGGK